MNIAIIGKGNVGKALGPSLAGAGHEVTYGVRDPADPKHATGDGLALATPADAAASADVIILAVNWSATIATLGELGTIAGKVLVDVNNPVDIAGGEPVLRDQPAGSLGAELAARTDAHVVKAINQVGATVMAHAHHYAAQPLQFLAGDDAAARATVAGLLVDIGFKAVDLGGIAMARHMESLAFLWIFQAFKRGLPQDSAWMLEGLPHSG